MLTTCGERISFFPVPQNNPRDQRGFMVSTERVRSADLLLDAFSIRHEVFVVEQQVPMELEQDDRDVQCEHVLVSFLGQFVATGRIDLHKSGKIGRVAVLSNYRQQGHGVRVMLELEQIAREANLRRVWLHAQHTVLEFYQTLGYSCFGEIFEEAGIKHVAMEKCLK